jgi:hypothetical protein
MRTRLATALSCLAGALILPGAAGTAALHASRHAAHSDQTWSGYAVTGGGPYTSITGEWTVPALDCAKGAGAVSPWIGIDGWSDATVEQIGVDLDCVGGKASYHTWVEMYPKNSVYFKEKVEAGDTLSASVAVSGSAWTLTESDAARGWSKTFHETSTDQLASAEAIVEDLGAGGAPKVDDFGTVAFIDVTVDGKPLAGAGTVHETTLERASTPLSRESALAGGAFAVTWLHR